jgi:site-specific DNA-adenine methylase
MALLNDINPHVVNFYLWLKRGLMVPPELEFANRADLYYQHRTRFNRLVSEGRADIIMHDSSNLRSYSPRFEPVVTRRLVMNDQTF